MKDYSFKSNCDTEVIIAAYLKWGIGFVDYLQGMFAIALFDKEEDILYLIRDRMGKKPLYYYLAAGSLYFSSELKPLMKNPHFHKQINEKERKKISILDESDIDHIISVLRVSIYTYVYGVNYRRNCVEYKRILLVPF